MKKIVGFNVRKKKNIVFTASNNHRDYFYRLLVLIAAIHRTSYNTVDEIVVYNLGFGEAMKKLLEGYEKVRVEEFPDEIANIYAGYLQADMFAWKCYVLRKAAEEAENVLWLDAGIAPLEDLSGIFGIIENEEVFFVDNSDGHYIENLTKDEVLEKLNVTSEERKGLMVCAGIVGYSSGGSYRKLFDEAFELSRIKEIIYGPKNIHRQDQSLYSILSVRYACPRQTFGKYGEWRGRLYPDQSLYVHRGDILSRKGARKRKEYKLTSKDIIELIKILPKLVYHIIRRKAVLKMTKWFKLY